MIIGKSGGNLYGKPHFYRALRPPKTSCFVKKAQAADTQAAKQSAAVAVKGIKFGAAAVDNRIRQEPAIGFRNDFRQTAFMNGRGRCVKSMLS
jgi:hypothetical protein